MRIKLLLMFSISFCLIAVFTQSYSRRGAAGAGHPKPVSEDEELEARKDAYIKLIHRAAPGTDWKKIEEQNRAEAYLGTGNSAAKTTSTFAGGALTGIWYERGNDNLAGRTDAFAFLPATSTLYATSDGGSIWKTSLPGVAWTKVSDAMPFSPYVLGVIQRGASGARLFTASGTQALYTDNSGLSFATSTGITFPVPWGGNYIYRTIPVNDPSHTVYCVTFGWDDVSWTALFTLYSSTDSGVSFHLIRKFPYHSDNQLSFCAPLGSGTLYALGVSDAASDSLFSITSSVVSVASVTTSFPAGDNLVNMKCMTQGGITHFYVITGGANVYHSNNFGNTWTLKSTLTPDNSILLGLSSLNPNAVSYGNVEAYRSYDSAASWTLVNTWGSYYGAMSTNLHADIRAIDYFQTTGGTEFAVVGTDGGAFLSGDMLGTVSNLSLAGLHVNQLWDHISAPTDPTIIFGGAQDQGLQHTTAAGGTSLINETQIISGDYGQLRITNNNTLWAEYPGGNMYEYGSLSAPSYLGAWTMSGTYKPNAGWMLPTSEYFTSGTADEILIGGGNITGDSGSYLSRLTLTTSPSFSITPFQYSYNFKANSNNGTSGISSVAISHLSSSLIYVGTEDGTFFYSTDAGTTWNKTAAFAGVSGFWLYGACILPSVDSVNKVYYGGSGYDNPAVYVSRDHGITFDSMSNGLPHTLVNRLASFSNDSFLFAATDAGPYVYVRADNQWYSLIDATIPFQSWKSVEYLASIKTVRFGTYGRGIWDLKLIPSVSTGVAGNAALADIKIAPNPVKSGGTFTVVAPGQQKGHLAIYDMQGRVILDKQVVTNSELIMPVVPAGVYVYAYDEGGKPQSGLLVVGI